MSNEKELVLFCRADGKWAVYDDTYDITIHCESQQEQDKAMELLHRAQQTAKEVMRPEDVAKALKTICIEHTGSCKGCPFESGKIEASCKLVKIPDEWDV